MRTLSLCLSLLAALAAAPALADDSRVVGPAGEYSVQVSTGGPTTIVRGDGYVIIQWAGAPVPTPDPAPRPDPAPKPDPKPDPAPKPDPTPVPTPEPDPEPALAKGHLWVLYFFDESSTTQDEVATRAALSSMTDFKGLDARYMAIEKGNERFGRYASHLTKDGDPEGDHVLPTVLVLDQEGDAKTSTVADKIVQPKSADAVLSAVKKLRGK